MRPEIPSPFELPSSLNRAALAAELPHLTRSPKREAGREAGMGSLEYIGVTVIVGLIIFGIAIAPFGKPLREGTQAMVCTITTGSGFTRPDGSCQGDSTHVMAAPPEHEVPPGPAPDSQDRQDIISRAKYWVEQGVPYSMEAYYPDPNGRPYRTDCSGFVSMAWGLDQSYSTVTLPSVAHPISKDELQPGDILLKGGPGTEGANGHVGIFNGWANEEKTEYYIIEQVGGQGAISRKVSYPYPGDNSYVPYRKNGL